MSIFGSCLSFPILVDQRGTLATVSDPVEIVRQSIASIIETRQGERVLLPDYGLPDFLFEVIDSGFAIRVAYLLEQQIRKYEPLVDELEITVGIIEDGNFTSGFTLDQQRAAIQVRFSVRGSGAEGNLVYPVWQLRKEAV